MNEDKTSKGQQFHAVLANSFPPNSIKSPLLPFDFTSHSTFTNCMITPMKFVLLIIEVFFVLPFCIIQSKNPSHPFRFDT